MNQLPPLPLIDGALFVDNSMLELFTTCPRALQYNKLNKRVLSAEAPALNFGSAIHLALELRYKTFGNGPVDPTYQVSVTELLTEHFESFPCPMDDYRNLNWALEVIRRYNIKYQQEDFDLLEYETPIECGHCKGKGKIQFRSDIEQDIWRDCYFCQGSGKSRLMVELPFALKLFDIEVWLPVQALEVGFPKAHIIENKIVTDKNGLQTVLYLVRIPIYYSGRIDLPNLKSDHLFVSDHKTTSLLGAGFFDQAKMSAQQKGYCFAFRELMGKSPRGYEINAIRTKEPPKWVNDPTITPPKGQKASNWWDESIQRERYILADGELDEWKENTIALVEEFFWHYSKGYFPRKTAWCVAKFGRCPYFEVCSTFPREDRLVILNSGVYKENTWSPLISPSQSKQQ